MSLKTEDKVHTIKWGILATGTIAQAFVADLLIDPATRDVDDVKHEVVAVGSRELAKAEKFCKDQKIPDAKPYGSYESLVEDKDIDIVYVASPHSEHFKDTMMSLNAGKHVLCEKAFTVNADQAKILCDTAKTKKLFLMEAQWTRFFPLSIKIRDMCKRGEIGKIWRVKADLSFGDEVETTYGKEHRLVNPALAGGCLLDLGLYPALWNFQILYHISPDKGEPEVASSALLYETGVDECTSVLLRFPKAIGEATTNFRVSSNPDGKFSTGPAIKIQGTHGEIDIPGPAYRPTRWTKVTRRPGVGPGGNSNEDEKPLIEEHEEPIPGHGMFWEADECARCIRDEKLESETMPHEESIAMMKVFDQVRQQNKIVYPANIESTTYRSYNLIPMIGL